MEQEEMGLQMQMVGLAGVCIGVYLGKQRDLGA